MKLKSRFLRQAQDKLFAEFTLSTFEGLRMTAEEIAAALALVALWALWLAVPADGQYRPSNASALQYRYSRVTLLRVVDGDTVRLDIETEPGRMARNRPCRFLRINAPELNQPGGPEAREALASFFKGKRLMVEVRAVDGFGRWLIELWAATGPRPPGSGGDSEAVNVADWMVEHGHAEKL